MAEPLGRKTVDTSDPFTPAIAEGLARVGARSLVRVAHATGLAVRPHAGRRRARHPDLVPWADLPEDRRQIDRDRVTALKPVLAAVRYRVVPIGG